MCLTGHYPVDCDVNPDIPCQRGGTLRTYLSWSFIGLSVVSGLVGILCTWAVLVSVRRQLQRSDRFSFRQSLDNSPPQLRRSVSLQQLRERLADAVRRERTGLDDSSGLAFSQRNIDPQDFNFRRRRAVARQAAMYTLAFMNPFLVSLVGSVLVAKWTSSLEQLNSLHESDPVVFTTVIIVDIFYSSQGFLNWLVFIHPTLARWRDAFPDRSLWWRYKQMLAGEPTPTTRNTAHLVVRTDEPRKRINAKAGADGDTSNLELNSPVPNENEDVAENDGSGELGDGTSNVGLYGIRNPSFPEEEEVGNESGSSETFSI